MLKPYLAVGAALTGISIVAVANGLLSVFLALRMTLADFAPLSIGVVVTAYSIGFLLGCLRTPRVIRQVGHHRAFAVFAALMGVVALTMATKVDVIAWSALRFVAGFAAAGLYVVAESWLASRTETATRGRVFSAYMIATKSAFGVGQLLLMLGDPQGLALFMVAAALYATCLIPVSLTRDEGPARGDISSYGIAELYRVSPIAVIGCFTAGMNNATIVGIAPVYAAAMRFDTAAIAWFVGLMQFGGLVLQYPIGRLADRIDRRKVVLLSAVGTAVAALGLLAAGGSPLPLVMALAALYGGISFTIYPVCAAHAADRAEQRHMVAIAGGLLLAWAGGSVIGPISATLLMQLAGPGGLFVFIASVTSGLILFILWRMTRRPVVEARFAAALGGEPPR